MLKRIIFLVLIIAIISCESVVDIDLPKEAPKIVVNSFITPDSLVKINLSKSFGIFEELDVSYEFISPTNKNNIFIENAKIQLFDGSEVKNNFEYQGKGNYKLSDFKLDYDKEYKIVINAENYKTVSAVDKIPLPILIDSVKATKSSDSFVNNLEIFFEDKSKIKNYYLLFILKKRNYTIGDKIINETSVVYIYSNDLVFNNHFPFSDNDHKFFGQEAFFSDEIFDGKHYGLKVGVHNKLPLKIVLLSISESMYKYFKSKKAQNDSKDNPFSEPVPVFNNIENGIGIFAGYSSSVYQVK